MAPRRRQPDPEDWLPESFDTPDDEPEEDPECLAAWQLDEFVASTLEDTELFASIEAHLERCARCLRRVEDRQAELGSTDA